MEKQPELNKVFSFTNDYLSALIDNVNHKEIPKSMDIVFSGGAFHGFYGYGISLFLQEMEVKKITQIYRVSGCSIGSLLALDYCIQQQYPSLKQTSSIQLERAFTKIQECFQVHKNIHIFKDIINDYLTHTLISILKKDNKKEENEKKDKNINIIDLSFLNDKLFISYYDLEKMEHVVISSYSSINELKETIYKSCYLPYIMDGKTLLYEDKYVDGMYPYVFTDMKRDCLFIQLFSIHKMYKMIMTKYERNCISRVIQGMMDANHFFTHGYSSMCSFIKTWTFRDYIWRRWLDYILFIMFYVYSYTTYIPSTIKESILFKQTFLFIKHMMNDFLYKFFIEE
jgi:hypothetical protein